MRWPKKLRRGAKNVAEAESVRITPQLYCMITPLLMKAPYVSICMNCIESSTVSMAADNVAVKTARAFTVRDVANATGLPYVDCVHACELLEEIGFISVDKTSTLPHTLVSQYIYTCKKEVVLSSSDSSKYPGAIIHTTAELRAWLDAHSRVIIKA